MTDRNAQMQRLADRILSALELALDQEDAVVAGSLWQALELSVTRGAGGKAFTERRDLDPPLAEAYARLQALKARQSGS